MNSDNRCTTTVCASALLAVAALGFSPAAWALGLGDAKVESYLNQPLQARIDLISQPSDDLASITAQLASAADYELIGASREAVSVPIRFSIEEIDGDAYILATSNLPVNDPVLRLIVEVSWSSGRMLREYTLFLDPPSVPEPAPTPRIDQRAAPSAPAAVAEPQEAPAVQQAAPEDAPPVTPAQPAAGSEYGPVRSGETLWAIASDWSRGSGLNINRVMIAIQRENPDAFLRDNINLLKRGAILRMPSMDAVNQISAASAYQEVVAQEQAFSGRAAASVASAETPLLAEESVLPAPAEEPPAAAPAEPAPAETPEQMPEQATEQAPEEVSEQAAADTAAQDLLELVPPSADSELDSTSGFEEAAPGGETDVAAQALREELARAEEELINQQQQNEYLEERIRELESQLAGRDEGTVADRDLASMEDRLREQRQAAPAPGAAAKPEQAQPWYARIGFWLIGLLVVVAAFVGWRFSRRGAVAGVAVADPAESLRGIKSEAEDLLRVLADDRERKPAAGAAADQPRQDAGRGAGQNAGNDAAAEAAAPAAPADKASPVKAGVVEDAELLDEDSSDPEIQLDLARAYISMGDKEAARVILQEVVNNGSEAQQAEARKMLGFL